ncbi:hypothetical protein [Amycolatopsis anabasis]|uniref:hypothetical protein n=1 Tax=Amycolatopsis anabasis TaxID=1840409 RepID=UPI00131E67CD|nr:hypothetical protein [Amycolatopsis anabasis]
MSWLSDAWDAVSGAVGDAVGWVGERIGDVGNWFGELFSGDLGAQAVPAPELVKKIMEGRGPGDWYEGSEVAKKQSGAQDAIADQSHELVGKLEMAWSGQSSEAARENIRPLATAADAGSQTLTANGENLRTQADQFAHLRKSLQKLADPPPDKDFWDIVTPWDSDTEDAVAAYNQAVKENIERYDGYHQQSTTSAQSLNTDYGRVPDDVGGDYRLERGKADPGDPGKPIHLKDFEVHGKDEPGRNRIDTVQPPPPVVPVDPDHRGPAVPSRPPGWSPRPGEQMPGYERPDETTHAAAFGPSAGISGGFQPSGFGPGAGFGPEGSSGHAPTGFGPVGGFGPGAGVPGGGSGAPGAGKSTGTGAPAAGNAGRPGAVPGGGAAGSRGGGGLTGLGGLGAGGGRGQGAEDEEHERPSFLLEGDPESVFGTDERTTPPVLGE